MTVQPAPSARVYRGNPSTMNPDGGFTRQFRRLWSNPVFHNKQEAAVFAWMTGAAAWRATSVRTRFGTIELERGELLITERQVSEDFGIDRKRLRNLLGRMSDDGMIKLGGLTLGAASRISARTATGTAAGTIVTIQKYNEYQGLMSIDGGVREPLPGPVPGPVTPKNTRYCNGLAPPKEGNEENESIDIRISESVSARACEGLPEPDFPQPPRFAAEAKDFLSLDLGSEDRRCAPPPQAPPPEPPSSAPADPPVTDESFKKKMLRQKLHRFCNATMRERDRMTANHGLMGGDLDPEHDAQWWFDTLHKRMKRARWDDTSGRKKRRPGLQAVVAAA
jgi:hypothetical protein